MLQITPQALHLLRSVQETHYAKEAQRRRERARKAARKAQRLSRDHRRRLIDGTAMILRRGDPTPFAFESFCRHGIRSGLCLRGWTWADADEAAADVVRAALRQIGATRPTYQQGQPEYTQDGVIMFERTRCVVCGWRLPPENRKFCGKICHTSYHNRLHRIFRAEQIEALEAVANAA